MAERAVTRRPVPRGWTFSLDASSTSQSTMGGSEEENTSSSDDIICEPKEQEAIRFLARVCHVFRMNDQVT